MSQPISDIKSLQAAVSAFAEERDWNQFHSPKNLAMALSIEASELMEHFQWLTEKESYTLPEKTQDQVKDEIADVLVYLTRLADKLDIDMWKAVNEKMAKNHQKYPADQVRGSAKKYTEYQNND